MANRIVTFLECHFDSGVRRFCTADADIDYSGQTWQGVGSILSIEQKTSKATLEGTGWSVTFSAIPLDLVAATLLEPVKGRPWTMVMIEYDEAGNNVRTVANDSGIMDYTELQSNEGRIA